MGTALAPYVIGAKNRLLQSNVAQRDEREAERLHFLLLVLSIEDHSMRRQVQSAVFLSKKLRLLLPVKFHVDIVGEENNTENNGEQYVETVSKPADLTTRDLRIQPAQIYTRETLRLNDTIMGVR